MRCANLSRRENSTLFITTLTVFFILLHKYSDQQDILVGTGVANRKGKEVENLIGMIINTIALRGDLSGDPGFREMIQRHACNRVRSLCPTRTCRSKSWSRPCSSNATCRTTPCLPGDIRISRCTKCPRWSFPELNGEIGYLHNGSAKFDLNLVFVPYAEQCSDGEEQLRSDRRITMKWEYATDLFYRGHDPAHDVALPQPCAVNLVRHPGQAAVAAVHAGRSGISGNCSSTGAEPRPTTRGTATLPCVVRGAGGSDA